MKSGVNNNLLIIGAGGHGRVVKETAESMGIFGEIDFLDDNSKLAVGKIDEYRKFSKKYKYAFVALGNPELRRDTIKKLKELEYEIPVIIHPTAYVSQSVVVGEGGFIGVNATINTNVVIEEGCIVGIGALIDHDSSMGAFSYVNAGGIVKAGTRVEEGIKIESGMVCQN